MINRSKKVLAIVLLASSLCIGSKITNYTYKGDINDILFDNDTLWVATTGGVVKYNAKENSEESGDIIGVLKEEDGLISNNVKDIMIGPDSSKWISTAHGITRIKDGNSINYDTSDGLISNLIKKIESDNKGRLWIFTYLGVSRFNGSSFEKFAVYDT
ncbi:MAG: hypothetical protein ACOCSE_06660, partial [Chitinivibrionales bacterium]